MSGTTAQQVVALMAELVADGDATFGRTHGEDALDVAREIQGALMARLEGNLGHVVLWEQFLRTPQEVLAAVTGVVASYMERDQVLAGWLEDALLHCQQVSPS